MIDEEIKALERYKDLKACDFTKSQVKELMKKAKGDETKAALLAGVSIKTWQLMLGRHGIKDCGLRVKLSKKQVLDYLEETSGNIGRAADLSGLSYTYFYKHVFYYKLEKRPNTIKVKIANAALERAKYLALTPAKKLKEQGEIPSIALLKDILDKLGHHIGYEEKPKEVHHSGDGVWTQILKEVDTQRNTVEIEEAEVEVIENGDSGRDQQEEID